MFLAFDRDGGVYKNAVLVEFKKYSASLDEKSKALYELPNNIGEIRKNNSNIQTIWAYIITKLDDNLSKRLKMMVDIQKYSATAREELSTDITTKETLIFIFAILIPWLKMLR